MYDIEYMKLVGRDCLSIHWDSLVPDPYLYMVAKYIHG